MIPSGEPLEVALERLVDGSIDPAERHALLLRLEAEPDGWRRCALLFLEDQALRQALGDRAVLMAPAPMKAEAVSTRAGRAWARPLLAASLVAFAFLLGLRRGSIAPVPEAPPNPPATVASGPPPEVDSIREVGWAGVEVDGELVREAPILAGVGLDDDWFEAQPTAVPDYVRAQWERKGYQVAERRRMVSINLDDGRRMAIPLGGVELQYVGIRPN